MNLKTLYFTSLLISSLCLSAPVYASDCPEGYSGTPELPLVTENSGSIEITVESLRKLGAEKIAADGWKFRSRSIAFGPGATAAFHSHDSRPEVVMMKHGSLTIYESNCKVGYEMKEGDIYTTGLGDAHWARNEGEKTAIMFVVDIYKKDSFPTPKKPK